MKYLCIRTCFVESRLWEKDRVYDLPDSMKDCNHFQAIEGEVKIEEQKSEFACPVCGRDCKSRIGLASHSRTHEE